MSMPREEVAFIAIHLLGRGTGVPEKARPLSRTDVGDRFRDGMCGQR